MEATVSTTAETFANASSKVWPRFGRTQYAGLALLFLGFAVYGSLVPFHLRRLPFDEAPRLFGTVLAQPIAVQSRSDWIANILLFLPLGFLLMGMGCCDRPRLGGIFLLPVIVVCVVLSTLIEFTQLYFPPRVSSINDIAAESLGGTLGALFWLVGGQRLTIIARRVWTAFGSRGTAGQLLLCYLLLLVAIMALPFDFTISPAELWHKYKEGRVHLTPFASVGVSAFELANKHFWNAACFAPLGVLLGHLSGPIWRSGRSWPLVLGLGLLVAGAVEFLQLFVVSRFCDVADVLTGGPAVLMGWAIVLVHRRLHPSPSASKALRWSLLAAWLGVLIFMEWQPFNFALNPTAARERLHHVSLLPFLDYYQGNYLHGLDEVVHKILLFVPLGVSLAPLAPASRGTILFRGSLALAVAVVLEAGQLFLPTRYASVSDVLVGGLAAGIGLLAACRRVSPPLRHTAIPPRLSNCLVGERA
ncbi:MAG TPA: VanZ family protein [Gemmataceae bacterium]|nr:VanZ family protein [Gemmataceae bacterium]